jgi:ethanolamine utilization protein EutM
MEKGALGVIEAVGLTTAVTALDAACKDADIKFIGYEKIIGVEKAVSVTISIVGQVSAVKSAVEAGVEAAKKVGTVVSYHVIPRPHEEMEKLINKFNLEYSQKKEEKPQKKDTKNHKKKDDYNKQNINNEEE